MGGLAVRIVITSAPSRPKPATGDRRFIRGVEHVRVQSRCTFGPCTGAYIVSNGRPVYEWIPLEQAPEYLRNKPGRLVGKRPKNDVVTA